MPSLSVLKTLCCSCLMFQKICKTLTASTAVSLCLKGLEKQYEKKILPYKFNNVIVYRPTAEKEQVFREDLPEEEKRSDAASSFQKNSV